jgi:heat shock protein 4
VRVNAKQDIHGIIHLSSAQMVEEVEEEAADAPAATEAAPIAADDAKKADAPAATEEEKKTKNIKKTNLEFKVSRPVDWTRDEVNKVYEAEVAMANTDRIVQETADKRNELESYIYDMRDKVSSDSHYGPFGIPTLKRRIFRLLIKPCRIGCTKTVSMHQGHVRGKVGGTEKGWRSLEAAKTLETEARPVPVTILKDFLTTYNKWVNESQTDEKYAHITDEERATVHIKCDETSTWLYGELNKQGGMAGNQEPVLMVEEGID